MQLHHKREPQGGYIYEGEPQGARIHEWKSLGAQFCEQDQLGVWKLVSDISDGLEYTVGVDVLVTSVFLTETVSDFVFGRHSVEITVLGEQGLR